MCVGQERSAVGPAPGTPEWLEARRRGIGGSDAAAVVGLSPWRTALEVYLDKIGQGESSESPEMRRGTLLEPVVRQMYADETGRTVHTPTSMFTNPRLPFALANLDGLASGEILLECKTSRLRTGWGEPGTAEIPLVYLCQVQHCLMVAELPRADVAVLFGDFEFAIYPVDADAEFQSLLCEHEAAFWELVQKRIPPEPVNGEDIKRRWPRNIVAAIAASAQDLAVARVLADVKAGIKTLEAIKDQAEASLKASIKDAEGLHVGGEPICTWKSAKGSARFDSKRFQAEHPELYEQYLTESAPSRRFLLKGNAKCLDRVPSTVSIPPIPENLQSLLEATVPQG